MTIVNAFDGIATLRDSLAGVAGVKTCKIGLESNMTPDDYPMVRIVPSKVADDSTIGRRRTDVLVYFGQPIHEFSGGMEALWQSHLTMETALLEQAFAAAGITFEYTDTVLDEDRVDAYKLLAIRGTVVA